MASLALSLAGPLNGTLGSALLLASSAPSASAQAAHPSPRQIPPTRTQALDGRTVVLPHNLPAPATVLILGFGRNSQDATTAWERPVRTQLASTGSVGFFDMAMLAEVPGLLRPLIVRAIKAKVPDVLKPHFLPLTDDEDLWKQAAGYTQDAPEAAYIMLVDRNGAVRWSTHAPFSPTTFSQLQDATRTLTP